MIYEISGICQGCAEDISITINNGELLQACPYCDDKPFGMKKYKGLVYVVSNPNQLGIKIGMTERTLEQRIKSLNSTGVVGKFEPVVIFHPITLKKMKEKFMIS